MFLKGHRVLTPFGSGLVTAVFESACIVELSNDANRRRTGTFPKARLAVCSIVKMEEFSKGTALFPSTPELPKQIAKQIAPVIPLTPRKKQRARTLGKK